MTKTSHLFCSFKNEGMLFVPDVLESFANGAMDERFPFHLPRGISVRDEAGRAFRIACAAWDAFDAKREQRNAAAVTCAFLTEIFRDVFGHAQLPETHNAVCLPFDFPVVFAPHTLDLDASDDRFRNNGLSSRRRSAAQFAQESLNAREDRLWAAASNGLSLRLMRDNPSLTRPCYLEFDLAAILGEKRYTDFIFLWRLMHHSRMGADAAAKESAWESIRAIGADQGVRVRDALRGGVTRALITLGTGFVANRANTALRTALESGAIDAAAFNRELLRLAYRFLFLFVAEERGILHDAANAEAERIYSLGYSMHRLLDRRTPARDDNTDLWQGVQVVFRALAHGEERLALPALGGLFRTTECANLDAALIDNRSLLSALESLRITRTGSAASRVDYRNMGAEELGSVYESLLELVPVVSVAERSFGFVGYTEEGLTAGNTRKSTGSYYTPSCLVDQLVKTSLDPVLDKRHTEETILAMRVIDPACGSGHFLLAAARRIAERLAAIRSGDDVVKPENYRRALRDVVTRCIYGADVNPMALELAKIALWIESLEPGKPLSFLDAHFVCGDATLGITSADQLEKGIPAAAYAALEGDDRQLAAKLKKQNTAETRDAYNKNASGDLFTKPADDLLNAKAAIDAMPDDTLEQVEAKLAAMNAYNGNVRTNRLARAANLFTAAFLLPKTPASPVPTSATLFAQLNGMPVDETILAAANDVCERARVLHWPLVFPAVFANGGFDCVLANPPWERIKIQEKEFFSARSPKIASARNAAERKQLIDALERGDDADRRLFADFRDAKRFADAASAFIHAKIRFPLTGVGDVNLYALFAELILTLKAQNGRAGFICPSGICSDDSTKVYFAHLASEKQITSIYDIENRQKIFSAVDSRFKFCLFTLGPAEAADLAFFLHDVDELDDERRHFSLSADEFKLLNPNTLTCPIFRSQRDAAIAKKIYRNVGVLWDETREDGNPWRLWFRRLFDMSNDSNLFLPEPKAGALPLYEAKLIHQFDHRWATYVEGAGDKTRDCEAREKADAAFEVRPRYWVEERHVLAKLADVPSALARAYAAEDEAGLRVAAANWAAEGANVVFDAQLEDELVRRFGKAFVGDLPTDWRDNKFKTDGAKPITDAECAAAATGDWRSIFDDRSPKYLMGWRDITNATNSRTVICSVIPRVAVGHKYLLYFSKQSPKLQACLLGDFNSLVHDWCARQKIGGTDLTYTYKKQIATLSPAAYTDADIEYIVPRVLELTYVSEAMRPWAEALGHDGGPFAFDLERRAVLRAELDVYYARKYGLSEEEFRYILDPADVMGADYPSESFRVLRDAELAERGEYRTKRLCLERWGELMV